MELTCKDCEFVVRLLEETMLDDGSKGADFFYACDLFEVYVPKEGHCHAYGPRQSY